MFPQSPLIVPAKKVVASSRGIVPSEKEVTNSSGCEGVSATSTKEEFTMTANWNQLMEEHELAYFRADVCLGSPQSFSLEEKKQICIDTQASTAEIDAALKADFEALPPVAQNELLNLLQKADPEHFGWWKETLLGEMPGGRWPYRLRSGNHFDMRRSNII